MPDFDYLVTVTAETQEQADTVMAARLEYCEEIDPDDGGPFDYTIQWIAEGGE